MTENKDDEAFLQSYFSELSPLCSKLFKLANEFDTLYRERQDYDFGPFTSAVKDLSDQLGNTVQDLFTFWTRKKQEAETWTQAQKESWTRIQTQGEEE